MFLCFYVARAQLHLEKVGSCAWKPTIVQPHEPKKPCLSVRNIFFQEQGKRASLPGCDLSDIRQRCRPVPSRAENQKSPCLPWSQCNSQSSQSMSWTEPLEHASQWFLLKEGEEWEKRAKKLKADGFDFIYTYKLPCWVVI